MKGHKPYLPRSDGGVPIEPTVEEDDWVAGDETIAALTDLVDARRLENMKAVIANRTRNLQLILDNVHDPHNLSAVMRSAESFGVQEVHIIHPENKPPMSRRISQGCDKWLDIEFYKDAPKLVDKAHERGLAIYTAGFGERAIPIGQLDFSRPAILALGNEHDGVGKIIEDASDEIFMLPMFGFTRSFNISVAAALSLDRAVRARIELLGRSGDLPDDEKRKLLRRWLIATVKGSNQILARHGLAP